MERRKPSFTKKIGKKCRLAQTRTEQNSDYIQIIHKHIIYNKYNFVAPLMKSHFLLSKKVLMTACFKLNLLP